MIIAQFQIVGFVIQINVWCVTTSII